MKPRLHLPFWACTVLCFLVAAGPTGAQAPEINVDQARQLLSAYLQAPDALLKATPTRTVEDGHTHYLFYGDHGGRYEIDAATLTKGLHYAGLSAADHSGQTPADPLSKTRLKTLAVAYVAHHFPGYVPGMFQITAPPIDIPTDADEYYGLIDK